MQNPRQPNRYQKSLDFKIALTQTKQVEDRGAQRFVETAVEDAAGAGHAILREKWSLGRDCKSLGAEVALLGPLYYKSAFFERRTNLWLAKLTVHKDNEVWETTQLQFIL